MQKAKERLIYLHGMMEAFDKLESWVNAQHRFDIKETKQSCLDEIKQLNQKVNIKEFLNNKQH